MSESGEQLEGETKEKVGEVAGDENTELQGEGQRVKADIEERAGKLREGSEADPGEKR